MTEEEFENRKVDTKLLEHLAQQQGEYMIRQMELMEDSLTPADVIDATIKGVISMAASIANCKTAEEYDKMLLSLGMHFFSCTQEVAVILKEHREELGMTKGEEGE
tara:strand:+ start:979 stop:1296 length:318 start_codon:yes stop_codon:yes gene_type:complete